MGSYSQWDRKLDGRLAKSVMAIPGIKAVSIGDGFEADAFSGGAFRDPISLSREDRFEIARETNHAGGLEGGLTNGEDLVVHAVMKPIPTMKAPIASIDLADRSATTARYERADVCAVHAAAVICENALCWVLADALTERYGGDTVDAMKAAFARDSQGLAAFWKQK